MIIAFILYTIILFVVSGVASRRSAGGSFYSAGRRAPWLAVAFGMIGASLSGLTFVSVPGNVYSQNFYYVPLVLGFTIGFVVVAKLLLPLYYKLELTSIYEYLEQRFGAPARTVGAVVFIISRLLGASVRIFIVVVALHALFPDFASVPLLTLGFMLLLFLYTFRGGVKAVIWTDVVQTLFMLAAVVLTIFQVSRLMGCSVFEMSGAVMQSDYSQMFDLRAASPTNMFKQIFAGIFMTVVMTGLDQGNMQKNIACRDLRAAQKNMYLTGVLVVIVSLLFLFLGAILSLFVDSRGGLTAIGASGTDGIFSSVVVGYLPPITGVVFVIGLLSAAYPSAGAALTSLTSSVCVDFLHLDKLGGGDARRAPRVRHFVHALVAVAFVLIIIAFDRWGNQALINFFYQIASYTYGPLLGLFACGLYTKIRVRRWGFAVAAVASPVLSWAFQHFCKTLLHFDCGFFLLIVNGAIMCALLYTFREKSTE
ncbi:MAG: sodium:solute symporter [Bacteroidales bacterium]|nr:sodium:solute symporter [Bacteroidales bacterium]